MTETTLSEDFILTDKTREWLVREYPQLDEQKTVDAFIEWAINQRDNNKRSKTYGEPLKCANWQMKFRNVVRIQMVNKWTTIAIAKHGQEVDVRWAEVLTHAQAIGCPIQRRPSDTVDSFRTRIKQWETFDKPRNVVNFGEALRGMK